MERLKKRSSISVSEVSGQDLWQRSVIGFSLVSGKYSEADFIIQLIRDTFYRYSDQLEITAFDFEIDNVFWIQYDVTINLLLQPSDLAGNDDPVNIDLTSLYITELWCR